MSKIDDLMQDVEKLGLSCEAGPISGSMAWRWLKEEIKSLQADAAKWRKTEHGYPNDTVFLKASADYVIGKAKQLGYVVRIETRPLQPLAMGNYEMVASVEPRRAPAVPYDQLNRKRSGGCPCEPLGLDGFSCPDPATGKPCCAD